MKKTQILTTALACAAALAVTSAPRTAEARDQEGLGIGAVGSLGGVSGLNIAYWLSPDMFLDFTGGFTLVQRDASDPGSDATFGLGLTVGFFGVLAEGPDTNLELGGRAGVIAVVNSSGVPDTADDRVTIPLEGVLRVEHWFGANFSIHGQVGVVLSISPDADAGAVGAGPNVVFGAGVAGGLIGGAGFTFYLDGSDSGASTSASSGGGSSSGSGSSSSSGTTSTGSTGGGEPDPESGAAGW